jgi:hypothetical protein
VGTNQTYEPQYTYQQQPISASYQQASYQVPTYTNTYAAPIASEVRNTSYNYGVVGGANANLSSQARNTVVSEAIAAPPKITFGHPQGGYATTNNTYNSSYPVPTTRTSPLRTSTPPQW